jgi:predicted HicB family RNase H-like nuclease
MPKATQSETQPIKRKPGAGAPKKEVTASVTLRLRVTPEQEKKFKTAAKEKNTSFSQWAIALFEKNS